MNPPPATPPLEVFLLGTVDFDEIQQVQRRLVYDLGEREGGGGALILCEHPATISVGRSGSRAHILADDEELRSQGVPVRWVKPRGRCVLHLPGQLVGYLALPLTHTGLDLRRYVDGLHQVLIEVLGEFDLPATTRPDQPGVFLGPSRVATVGVAVNRWIAYHGFTLNVSTFLGPFEAIGDPGPGRDADPPDLDGVPPPAPGADGQGPRGGDPAGRGRLRPGAAPPLHAPPPDPAEGRHACLRPEPRLTPVPSRS